MKASDGMVSIFFFLFTIILLHHNKEFKNVVSPQASKSTPGLQEGFLL